MGYNPTFAGGRVGWAGQDPSVKRATVLTIHLPSVSPPRPRPAAVSDWFSYIHYKPQVCNVGLAGAGAVAGCGGGNVEI